jgi:hypothetical protein
MSEQISETIAAETSEPVNAATAGTLTPDLTEAERFLAALAPGSNSATRCWTFQTFDDNKDRKDQHLARVLHGSLDEHAATLAQLNAQGAGIFVTVNETNLRGRTTENIVKVRAVFSDLDGAPLVPVLASEPAPHIVVESSPDRWHPYWLPSYVRLKNFRALQQVLIRRYGGDPAVHDLPRVLRLPGFIHRKGEPFRTRIHSISEQPRHKLKELFTRAELRAARQARPSGGGGGQQGAGPTPTFNVNSRTLKVINDAAMANLAAWVPQLFPAATEANGKWRITSAALGRNLEEDISITAEGIMDFGLHDQGDPRRGKRTPIELVQAWRHPDQGQAAEWLRAKLNLNLDPVPIITLADWLARELEQPDFICGKWLTTTSRVIVNAETGIGKTLWGIALGICSAAGLAFLHWAATRQINVLYVDGEMARRVMKARLQDAVARLGDVPPPTSFHMLSHEDVQHWQPLNSVAGQSLIEAQIQRIGSVDLIIFDNIMSLIAGDQKDEVGWEQAMPWVRSLTQRHIAQVWLHHTGHDTTRGYGTKTREWQMDNVLHFEKVERTETDVSFKLTFVKAREREPATRNDFRDVKITLTNNVWTWEAQSGVGPAPITAAVTLKFYEALCLATAASDRQVNGCPAATVEEWKAQCEGMGLIDTQAKPHAARTLLSRHRVLLVSANWIACNDTMAWTLAPNRHAGAF